VGNSAPSESITVTEISAIADDAVRMEIAVPLTSKASNLTMREPKLPINFAMIFPSAYRLLFVNSVSLLPIRNG
jgi:hypothetical protein